MPTEDSPSRSASQASGWFQPASTSTGPAGDSIA